VRNDGSSTEIERSEGQRQCQGARIGDGNLSAGKSLEPQVLLSRITLISHAATLASHHASFPLDEAITEGELEKIAAIGWAAPRAQQVCCGPERRTWQTATALGLQPTETVEISEFNYGMWGGKQIDEIQASNPAGLAAWLTDVEATPHGGESVAQLIARVGAWLEKQTNAGHTVAVTHPAVIRGAILCCLQAPLSSFWRLDIAPLSLTDLRFNGNLWTARSSGCPLSRS
jgi:broad specificity phosphatase PhoE